MPFDQKRFGQIAFGLIAAAMLAIVAFSMTSAKAHAWSGCGLQVHGGHAIADASAGGPLGVSSTGQLAGVSALCDLAIAKTIVVGAFVSAEKAFGDLDTLGVDRSYDVGGRAGFLLGDNVLFYGHAAWTRVEITGGHVDGYKWGPGIEVKLPTSAWSMDARYQMSDLDTGIAGVDVEARSFRLGLSWKFGGQKELESIFTPEVSAPCDKKLANCK